MKQAILKRIGLAANAGLLLVSLFGLGALNVGASINHQGMSHDSGGQLGCQQKCSSATTISVTQTKKEVDRQQDKKKYSYPVATSDFPYDRVRRLTHAASDDFRLLRPPDLLALHSIYRI